MIQNLIFKIICFENIFSGIQLFYILPLYTYSFLYTSQCPSGHLQSFVCPESVKVSKNYRKKSIILQYSFNQKTSLILRTSTHIENNMVLQHFQNLSEFTKNFPVNMLVWCQKKHLHPTVSRRPKLHS